MQGTQWQQLIFSAQQKIYILKNAGDQTFLMPIDFHCTVKKKEKERKTTQTFLKTSFVFNRRKKVNFLEFLLLTNFLTVN